MRCCGIAIIALIVHVESSCCLAQNSRSEPPVFVPNYDESQVPAFQLPPILATGSVSDADVRNAWKARRLELLNVFTAEMFGSYPPSPYVLECQEVESGLAFEGKALRQQFRVTVTTDSGSLNTALLVFSPVNSPQPVPCFLALNFRGNHTVNSDPAILVPESWVPGDDRSGVVGNRATEAGRGTRSHRWECELLIENGCAIATAYCGDIDPDFDDDFQNGIHALFPAHRPSRRHPDRWGTIAAWSWGLSRMLDCIEKKVHSVDPKRVIVMGHSRLGKTALWAAATDTRFAGVISNNSGCGGAALSRRKFGETVWRINNSFPHWFCGNFRKYSGKEESLPFDQHQLLALTAPRKLYVASASKDLWADPRGEFMATKLAGEFYRVLGGDSLGFDEFPKPGQASIGQVSYHLRDGDHDVLEWDWKNYIEFAKLQR